MSQARAPTLHRKEKMLVTGGLDIDMLIVNRIKRIDVSLVYTYTLDDFFFGRLFIRVFSKSDCHAHRQNQYKKVP
jgi:hypothetical protein